MDCGGWHVYLEVFLRRVRCRDCDAVKRERLDWLADNLKFSHESVAFAKKNWRRRDFVDFSRWCRFGWVSVKEADSAG